MLELLHIENLAVIETADIQFYPGFNALTGETGAGKSIVVDAMQAVLGGRASRDLIRTGAGSAFVSAVFSGLPGTFPALSACGAEADEEGKLLLQREITADGRNVCRANGRPLTVSQLRAVGWSFSTSTASTGNFTALDERHGEYLDRYGRTERVLSAYQKEYEALLAIRRRMGELQMDEAEKARRMDSLRFQIDELERADLRPAEDEELRARRDFLRSGEKYLSALEGTAYALGGGDDSDGAARQLQSAAEALTPLRSLGGEFAELCERVQEAAAEVYDLSETLRDKREEFDFSPGELDAVESRCDQLYRLKKKYGATAEDMLAYLDRCRRELDTIETSEEELARLERKLAAAEGKVRAAGEALTAARKAAAGELEQRIQTELRELDMKKVRFAICFEPKEPTQDGCDAIRFLMSANAGEDLKPIAKIASGGELARIMLALKNVLSEQEDIGTLVFDEVDTASRPGRPEGGGETGPRSAAASRCSASPISPAGRHGGCPFLRGEGRGKGKNLYASPPSGALPAPGGASPHQRRRRRDGGPAAKRRRAAGRRRRVPGGPGLNGRGGKRESAETIEDKRR